MMSLSIRHARFAMIAVILAAAPPVRAQSADAVHHATGRFGERTVRYDAQAERYAIAASGDGAAAEITDYAYLAKGASDRPVVFLFNGGPGSSSAWLHMAAFGPRRAVLPQADDAKPGSRSIVANTDCILDAADLVFVDPVGTGYSRLGNAKAVAFYGVDADARATVDFIRQWLTRHRRWGSPVHLIGESYGTVRVAATVKVLMGGTAVGRFQAIDVSGALLLGAVLDTPAAETGPDRDQGQAMLIPGFAATAWHYKRAGTDATLLDFVERARVFARDVYLPALFAGDRLPPARRHAVAQQLAGLIGLPVERIEAERLRVSAATFASALLADRGRRISLYDSRFNWPVAIESGHDPVGEDPAMTRLGPPVIAAMMDQLDTVFGIHAAQPYELISWVPNRQWDDGPPRDFAADLGRAMRQNPAMRLVVAEGYFDLATPMGATDHALSHGDIPQDRLTVLAFPDGHMTYASDAARAGLNHALRAMVTK